VRVAVVAFLFASLVACRGKSTPPSDASQPSKPAPVAQPIDAAKEPAPNPAGDSAIVELEAIRDRACACTDAPCARAVHEEVVAFLERHGGTDGTEEQAAAVTKLFTEMTECEQKALGGAELYP